MEKKSLEEWKAIVDPALTSKVEEFVQVGLKKTTKKNVWKCLEDDVWKDNPDLRIHQVVQDIMNLSSNNYMTYLMKESNQDDDLMASIEAVSQE